MAGHPRLFSRFYGFFLKALQSLAGSRMISRRGDARVRGVSDGSA
jgi:hypothetical protein